eukprot:4068299-Ditylum_brightwellii.AAC.1
MSLATHWLSQQTQITAANPQNVEEPNFESIRSIHKLLNQNTTVILCGAYGNTLGLLGLILTSVSYRMLANANFNLTARPPPPVLPLFASNMQVSEIMRMYKETMKQYNKYMSTTKALKNQLLGAFDNN